MHRTTRRDFLNITAGSAFGLATLNALLSQQPNSTRRVAVTIDDGPAVGVGNDLEQFVSISTRIREAFLAEKVPAIMFVNEQQLNVDGQRDRRAQVLKEWIDSGLELGNHTYSHKNLNEVELWQYFDEIVKGEVITRPLLEKRGLQLKWFRYPYLSSGSGDKAQAVEDFLAQRNYQIAPVTVDYADYSFASNYARFVRAGDEQQATNIVRTVMGAIDMGFERAEKRSQELLGHELPLVLLIHCNELNARNLAESLARMRNRGYQFISLDEAMQAAAYQTELPPGSLGGGFFAGLANSLKK